MGVELDLLKCWEKVLRRNVVSVENEWIFDFPNCTCVRISKTRSPPFRSSFIVAYKLYTFLFSMAIFQSSLCSLADEPNLPCGTWAKTSWPGQLPTVTSPNVSRKAFPRMYLKHPLATEKTWSQLMVAAFLYLAKRPHLKE